MKPITRAVYGLFGVAALVAGVAVLIKPAFILSPDVYSPLTAHLVREEAAVFLFVGLMCFWCIRHYEQRRPVHLALLVFTTVFAGIHWADYLRTHQHISGALVNSVPSLLLLLTFNERTRQAAL